MDSTGQCLTLLLEGLALERQTMQLQMDAIDETIDKSNITLFHVEQNNTSALATACKEPEQKLFTVKPSSEKAFINIIDNFQQMMAQTKDSHSADHSPLDSCLALRQRAEYLASSVRKLLALCDTANQMKASLNDILASDAEEEQEADSLSDCSE